MKHDVIGELKKLNSWTRDLILGSVVEGIDPSVLPWSDADLDRLAPLWNALLAMDDFDRYGVFRWSFDI